MKFLTSIKQVTQFASAFAVKLALLNWLHYIYKLHSFLATKSMNNTFPNHFSFSDAGLWGSCRWSPSCAGGAAEFPVFQPVLCLTPGCGLPSWLPGHTADWLLCNLLPTSTPRPLFLGAFSCAGSVKPYEMSDWSKSSLLLCPGVAARPGCQWSFVHLWIVPWPWRRIVPVLSPWIAVRGCTQPFHQPTWPQADASSMQTLVTSAGLCHFEFCSQCLFWSVLRSSVPK